MGKPDDTEWAFSFMNTTALVMEVLGGLTYFLIKKDIFWFLLTTIFAYLVAYVMNWAVVSSKSTKYMFFAIVFEILYAAASVSRVFFTFITIVPPIFFLIKAITSLYCAYFASVLRNRIKDAEPLGDEEIAQ